MNPRNILTKCTFLLSRVVATASVFTIVSCVSHDLHLSSLNLKASQHTVDKEYDQAIALYTRLIEEGYFLQGTYAARGFAYEQKRDFEKALEDYTRAIEHGGHHLSRAQLLQKIGDYEKAAADWSRVIQNESFAESRFAWYGYRSKCYRELLQYDYALSDLNKALDLGPNKDWTPILRLERAVVYRELGELDKALADADAVAELRQKDPLLYVERGEIYRRLKQNQKALADFDKAVELGSPFSDRLEYTRLQWAYAYRAALRIQGGEYDKALKDLDQAISLDPGFAFGYVQIGAHHFYGIGVKIGVPFMDHLEDRDKVSPILSKGRKLKIDIFEHGISIRVLRHKQVPSSSQFEPWHLKGIHPAGTNQNHAQMAWF